MNIISKLFTLTFCLLLFAGCKENQAQNSLENTIEGRDIIKTVTSGISNIKDTEIALAQMTPVPDQKLSAWLPDNLGGMKRTSLIAGELTTLNTSSLLAVYKELNKSFKVRLVDGAGEAGVSNTSQLRLSYSMLESWEEDTDSKTVKAVDRKGIKALVENNISSNTSHISFMANNNRFFFIISGTNMTIEELWTIIDQMDFGFLI